MYWTWRPLSEPYRFWDWAMDPHADLDHDTDLDLHDARFLDGLVAAADRSDCPNGGFCCRVLEDLTPRLAIRGSPAEVTALRAAIGRATAGDLPRVRRWAAYARRVLGYREPAGRTTRAAAERMAADLLAGPSLLEDVARTGRRDWITVETAANGRLWLCRAPERLLYVSRRSGAWRLARTPLPDTDLRTLR